MKDIMNKSGFKFNFLDIALVLLGILAIFCAYFSLIRPLKFSNAIERESQPLWAEVELLLPEDLQWMKTALPAGESKKDGYGTLEWKILEVVEKEVLPGQKRAHVRAQLLVYASPTSVPRYGKYPLVKGSQILIANSHFMIEGRLVDYKLLGGKIET